MINNCKITPSKYKITGLNVIYENVGVIDFYEPEKVSFALLLEKRTKFKSMKINIASLCILFEKATQKMRFRFGDTQAFRLIVGRDLIEANLVEPTELQNWDKFYYSFFYGGDKVQLVGWTSGLLCLPE